MNSASPVTVYTGTLRHRRFTPVTHMFTMNIAMLLVDIDEWAKLFEGISGWSSKHFHVAWLRERDYLSTVPGLTLRDRVEHTVQEATGKKPRGKILLLTHPRYFGFLMNPISCFYCLTEDGKGLEYMVAEVTNTPWRERIAYVLPCENGKPKQHIAFDKAMHVSPFNPLDMTYLIHFNTPASQLNLHLENRGERQQKVTDATLLLKSSTDSYSALTALLWRYPFMTLQVGLGIYWQALCLWFKGAPLHDHRPRKCPIAFSSISPKEHIT